MFDAYIFTRESHMYLSQKSQFMLLDIWQEPLHALKGNTDYFSYRFPPHLQAPSAGAVRSNS